MTLKRSREEVAKEAEAVAMANCALYNVKLGLDFECKTCKKRFRTFQALGGHRASHKRPKIDVLVQNSNSDDNKKKHECSICGIHECSICGMQFDLGQALGGHMRKHRGQQQQKQQKSEEKQQQSDWKATDLIGVERIVKEEEDKKLVLFGIDLRVAVAVDCSPKLFNFF